MSIQQIDPEILAKAQAWLADPNIDLETKASVQSMIDANPAELTESFYCNLEFGTGGLRGIMGAGTNRMNKYTVGMATQGLANYLKSVYPTGPVRLAIAYDSRNNSRYFAEVTAGVLAANGMQVFLFSDMRPTPVLSFAVRHLQCHSGVVVTASHNPKEYNGYKVYWNDGAQLVPPHDKNVIAEVLKISQVGEVKFAGNEQNITLIGEEVDQAYLAAVKSQSLATGLGPTVAGMKIVYTPLHGTGITMVPRALKMFGFDTVSVVEAQAVPDGNFPTIHSPNPEETAAMRMALDQAQSIGADLILATDPDADRIGVGLRDLDGKYVLLNGNQTAALLTYYLVKQWQAKGKLTGKEFIVKTIVTSELISDIAKSAGIEYFDVLTGFKWIAEIIRNNEGKKKFIGGGEESYGFMIGDFVRDKDAVVSCCIFAECAAWAASQGKSLFDLLVDLYVEYGFFKEKLVNIVRKGISGQAEIKAMMDNYRSSPPKAIDGVPVVEIRDYKLSKTTHMADGTESPIALPKSDVLQFFLADGSKISVRPSGTEPKIKFYFSIKAPLANVDAFRSTDEGLEKKVNGIIQSMQLN